MTPVWVTYPKLNGERGEKLDDGTTEAMSLAHQSTAFRFLERISKVVVEITER